MSPTAIQAERQQAAVARVLTAVRRLRLARREAATALDDARDAVAAARRVGVTDDRIAAEMTAYSDREREALAAIAEDVRGASA